MLNRYAPAPILNPGGDVVILNRTLTHPKSQIYTEPAGAVREASEPRSPLRSVRPYALVTAAVYAFSSIPYVFGYLSQNNGMAFTWIVFESMAVKLSTRPNSRE